MHHGNGKASPLAHAGGQGRHPTVEEVPQREPSRDSCNGGVAVGNSDETPHCVEHFAHRESGRQSRRGAEVAKVTSGGGGVGLHMDAGEPGVSRGGALESHKHAHGGGLACAVGSEQGHNLALAHLEVELVDRPNQRAAGPRPVLA